MLAESAMPARRIVERFTPQSTRVLTATRAWWSSWRMVSRTASEILSAVLSGWPSETDSEVKRVYSLMVRR